MPKAKEIKDKEAVQLLVEGNDVRNFFEAFIDHHSKKLSLEEIQIQNFGGVTELSDFLEGFVGITGFHNVRSIGIVRDAEKSAENAFRSVQGTLRKVRLPVPDCPEKPKTNGKLTVNVLILPGGDHTKGMLETLLCQTFAGTKIDGCIDEFFQCVQPLLEEPIKKHREDKARTFAYLTTRPNPHHSVGVAAKKKDWDLDHEVFGGIREFLKRIVVFSEIE